MAARRRGAKARRIPVDLSLTKREIQALERRAAGELRSVSNFVSRLVVEHLRRRRRAPEPAVRPEHKRLDYSVQVWLTPAQRRQLAAKAEADWRTVGNYVTTVVLDALAER